MRVGGDYAADALFGFVSRLRAQPSQPFSSSSVAPIIGEPEANEPFGRSAHLPMEHRELVTHDEYLDLVRGV